jgi:hypothetical protein
MSVNDMSVNDMSFNEMSVNETSVNEMSVNEMSVNEMSVNEMSVDKMSWRHCEVSILILGRRFMWDSSSKLDPFHCIAFDHDNGGYL